MSSSWMVVTRWQHLSRPRAGPLNSVGGAYLNQFVHIMQHLIIFDCCVMTELCRKRSISKDYVCGFSNRFETSLFGKNSTRNFYFLDNYYTICTLICCNTSYRVLCFNSTVWCKLDAMRLLLNLPHGADGLVELRSGNFKMDKRIDFILN